jgi:hypothetical protein
MLSARNLSVVFALLAPMLLAVAVAKDEQQTQLYRVEGKDSFQIGTRGVRSNVLYSGTEILKIVKIAGMNRYVATATYDRTEEGETHKLSATFVSTELPGGHEHDEKNEDPHFLTVLNQPFAAQLDTQTLHEVRSLTTPAPFSFNSGMTGTTLNGTIFHVRDGVIAGHPVVGIGFDASGVMRGRAPDHPEISLRGTIRMTGRAYYTSATALLLGLDETLSIAGTLADANTSDPVHILYVRTFRAE